MKLTELRSLDKLYVYKDGQLAGELIRLEKGVKFVYDVEYLQNNSPDIAFHLPTRKEPYNFYGDNLPPFFAGLLPEGLRLNALVAAIKTSSSDMFSLLAASGADAIGDVTIHIDKQLNVARDREVEDISKISFQTLFEESINALNLRARKRDPGFAGVTPKVSAQMLSIPIAASNKRYILKLNPPELPRLIQNEHYFMKAAQSLGLVAAKTVIVKDKDHEEGLLVERFDRISLKRKIHQLHQEDACQFLDRYPQDKYRLSCREIADGIGKWSTSPAIEVSKFTHLLAASYVIGNGDLHAKNISLVSDTTGKRFVLSPVYDFLSTVPYGDSHMALQFEGRDDNLTRKDFIRFANSFGVREEVVLGILAAVTKGIKPWLSEISTVGFGERESNHLRRVIEKRIKDLG